MEDIGSLFELAVQMNFLITVLILCQQFTYERVDFWGYIISRPKSSNAQHFIESFDPHTGTSIVYFDVSPCSLCL